MIGTQSQSFRRQIVLILRGKVIDEKWVDLLPKNRDQFSVRQMQRINSVQGANIISATAYSRMPQRQIKQFSDRFPRPASDH